jgi:hypothetical protein
MNRTQANLIHLDTERVVSFVAYSKVIVNMYMGDYIKGC